MKIFKSSSGLFTLAFILLLTSNIFILAGVYFNRSSEITSLALLTQRELQMPYADTRENNNLTLRIVYRSLSMQKSSQKHTGSPNFLNATKLRELGFDTQKYVNNKYFKQEAAREAFVVLEYDGEAYQKSLRFAQEELALQETLWLASKENERLKENYEEAKKNLLREQTTESRLFLVDAGLEYEKLRTKYANKDKYIIVKGLVQVVPNYKLNEVQGYMKKLLITHIQVPYKFKHIFKNIDNKDNFGRRDISSQKYMVEIKYGSRYEPWISSVNERNNSYLHTVQ
jgi:hypothetical protein